MSERNYKFRLSKYSDSVRKWLDENPIVIPSARLHDLTELFEEGLEDISVSRSKSKVKWGISVPEDPEQIIYVWLDALVNYMTATGYPTTIKVPDIHVVGKDILKFHAVYWPAFLMAAGYELPKKIVTHGHWTMGEEKMSKSLGNVIDPMDVVDKFGLDAFRYYLLKEGKIDSDSSICMIDSRDYFI